MNDEELDLTDFLEELAELCNAYGVELAGCPDGCGVAIIQSVDKPIEEYELEGNHLFPIYAKLVKAA